MSEEVLEDFRRDIGEGRDNDDSEEEHEKDSKLSSFSVSFVPFNLNFSLSKLEVLGII